MSYSSDKYEQLKENSILAEINDGNFELSNLIKYIKDYASKNDMPNTIKALELMLKYHEGAYRKGNRRIPYAVHPLMVTAHAIAYGIGDDFLLPACLLHDVLEDTDANPENLEMPLNVIEAVQLVSFDADSADTKKEAKRIYFQKISENRIASLVKILDRCNNISGMTKAFSKTKIDSYIEETYTYVIPLLDNLENNYPELKAFVFSMKYHMLSVLETIIFMDMV